MREKWPICEVKELGNEFSKNCSKIKNQLPSFCSPTSPHSITTNCQAQLLPMAYSTMVMPCNSINSPCSSPPPSVDPILHRPAHVQPIRAIPHWAAWWAATVTICDGPPHPRAVWSSVTHLRPIRHRHNSNFIRQWHSNKMGN